MPFARAPGAVAVGLQVFAQHYMVVGNALARAVEVKERASGCATWRGWACILHPDVPPGMCACVNVVPSATRRSQDRCLYVCIAQRANGVKSLVVGKKEEDVGFLFVHIFLLRKL